jgi:hypothetical protein
LTAYQAHPQKEVHTFHYLQRKLQEHEIVLGRTTLSKNEASILATHLAACVERTDANRCDKGATRTNRAVIATRATLAKVDMMLE